MTKFHYFLIRTTYYDPDVTGFNAWKRQWSLPVVSRINEKKKREFTDLIVSGVAQDWVKGLLKDKEGKVYNPEYLQIEGTPLVTTIEPEKDYIPLVKVEDNIELLSAQPTDGKKKNRKPSLK